MKHMEHYVCEGCKTSSPEMTICEQEGCTGQWNMMEECICNDGLHGASVIVQDAHGNTLETGDSVTLIKDLTLRGTSQVIKRGTKVKNIRITDNPEEIDCKIEGSAIVLRVEFVKKV